MIIDFHTHVHPPREQARPIWQGKCPATIENVLRVHEAHGLDLSVISSAGHYLRNFSREEAVAELRDSNDYLAGLRDQNKDRVVALATSIPGGGEKHLRELERAIDVPGPVLALWAGDDPTLADIERLPVPPLYVRQAT